MNEGYSKRSLVQKLGIRSGLRVAILYAPPGYDVTLGTLPDGVTLDFTLNGTYDFIQAFAPRRINLEAEFPRLKAALVPNGSLWISWLKGAAKRETNLDENTVREIGLNNGLVDVKVIAVDKDWSGLKFVYRLKDRA
jgi:hypothetical protein